MVEETEPRADDRRAGAAHRSQSKPGQNVLPRGREMRAGDVVLPAGTVLTPAARRAARGRRPDGGVRGPPAAGRGAGDRQRTRRGRRDARPRPDPQLQRPDARRPGGARRGRAAHPRHRPRRRERLAAMVRDGLDSVRRADPGRRRVGRGKFDLVPDVLRDLGVEVHFHKVRMKPGKPLLFGTRGDTLVFGLPGNPVSAFVCFELFVRPALRALAGHRDPGPTTVTLPLCRAARRERTTGRRTTPRSWRRTAVRPLPWFGSADLRALLTADALLVLPPGEVRARRRRSGRRWCWSEEGFTAESAEDTEMKTELKDRLFKTRSVSVLRLSAPIRGESVTRRVKPRVFCCRRSCPGCCSGRRSSRSTSGRWRSSRWSRS